MSEQCCDTKSKIMDAANELIYLYGFEGASIRQIATKADVNIAAVNYHFKNKENLFIDVFKKNFEESQVNFLEFEKQHPDETKAFSMKLFKYYLDHGPELLTCFKFLIGASISTEECIERCKDMPEGPPGTDPLMRVIKNELKLDIEEKYYRYATLSLASLLAHKALMLHSGVIKARIQISSSICSEDIENCLFFQIDATLNYLRRLAKEK